MLPRAREKGDSSAPAYSSLHPNICIKPLTSKELRTSSAARHFLHMRSLNEKLREYLEMAEEARRSASRAKDADTRKPFEKLASGWQQLADDVAQIQAEQQKAGRGRSE